MKELPRRNNEGDFVFFKPRDSVGVMSDIWHKEDGPSYWYLGGYYWYIYGNNYYDEANT